MKFLRHLAGYLPVNIASGLAAFGTVYVFTRLLDADEYGRYALMFTVMSLVHMLSMTAAEAAAFRFTSDADTKKTLPDHFRTTLSLTVRSLAVASVLLGLLALALRQWPEYLAILPWVALLIPINSMVQTALEVHRASERVGRYAVISTTQTLVGFSAGAWIAWQTGFGASSPFIGLVIGGVFWSMTETRWLFNQAKGGTTNAARRRTYLWYGAPIAAALALDTILAAADRVLIAIFLGEAAVGEYAAGYGVADKSVLMICAWAAMAAVPLVMAAYDRDGPAAAAEESKGLIQTLLLLGIPAATGLALVAEPLSEALIGEAVRDGARQIIPWIAFAGLLNGLNIHYYTSVFHHTHRTGELALLMVIPAVANILMNLILIPQFGLVGSGRCDHCQLPISADDPCRARTSPDRASAAAIRSPQSHSRGRTCMAPVIWLIPDLSAWPELVLKIAAGGAIYVIMAFALDAGGARGFVRDKLASKGHASA